MNKLSFILNAILITIIGILVVFVVNPNIKNSNLPILSTDASANCQYKYLNPLRCETEMPKKKKEYVSLKNDLQTVIEENKRVGKVTTVSVYFRDLQNGPLMSLNANEEFAPASILKVPLLMTYLKKAEDDPSLLKKRLRIVSDITTIPQNVKPRLTIEKGKEYSIDEVLTILITQSDNVAQELLLKYLKQEYSEEDFIETLSDLGIIDPRKRDLEQYIAVNTYAAIFRILYNSSYLNFEMSNKALKLLSQSEFRDAIVAGVPGEVKVAHKFGEIKRGSEQQLHDCGIVYSTHNPYLICILTKGHSISEQKKVIQQISAKVYEEVDSRKY